MTVPTESPTPPSTTSPPPSAAARRGRDPWFDNAKMALVTLVVVGHAWTLLPSEGLTARLYDFLYMWHMPAFLVVTGYLSRSFRWEGTRLWKLVRTVLVPYLVFETAMALFRVHVGGEQLEDLWIDPHWPMWFLLALFAWRMVTPAFVALRGGLAVAVAISLVGGVWATDTLDLGRVLGFLPFFVLGLKATPEHWERLRTPAARAGALLVLAATWALSAHVDRWASTEWLYYRAAYDELGVGLGEAMAIRGVLLLVGAAAALSFLALVPRTGGWFARMGAWTITVYLFHGFAVKGALYAGYADWAAGSPAPALALTTAGAVLLALLLAWRPVAGRLDPAVDPFGHAERRVDEAAALRVATEQARELVGAGAGAAAGPATLPRMPQPDASRPAPRPRGGSR